MPLVEEYKEKLGKLGADQGGRLTLEKGDDAKDLQYPREKRGSAVHPHQAGGNMRTLMVLAAIIALLSGCSSYTVAKYGVSPENVTVLRTIGGQKVNVGPFRATKTGQTEIMCRGVGPIKSPDGGTFEEYIRKAFIDDLKVANLFADPAPVTITGNLDKIDFSSTGGKWNIDLTLTSSNGRTMAITEAYDYESSFIGEKACALTAQAFVPAVQSLIGKAFRRPEFAELLK